MSFRIKYIIKNKQNMKHIMTFESYSSVNEEFLGIDLDFIYNKLKGALSSWRDRRTKSAAEKIAKLMDDKKDDPKFKEALENVKKAAANLSQEDKEKIANFSKGEIPEGAPVTESSINENTESVINKFLKIFGLSTGAFGLFSAIFTLLKITGAIAGSAVFGIHIGTAIAIFAGLMAAGGILGAIGAVRSNNDSQKQKSEDAFKRAKDAYGMK